MQVNSLGTSQTAKTWLSGVQWLANWQVGKALPGNLARLANWQMTPKLAKNGSLTPEKACLNVLCTSGDATATMRMNVVMIMEAKCLLTLLIIRRALQIPSRTRQIQMI